MSPGTSAMVGRRSSVVTQVHHAEVRLERGERVVGDLRLGGGHGREERRLAGVGQPDEPDVGDEPQLEPEPALLAGFALLGVLGRLVGRRLEVGVAEPAAPAAGDHRLLAGRDEVGEQGARLVVEHGGPGRHVEDQVVARLAVPARAGAAATGRRLEVVPVLEVAERGLARDRRGGGRSRPGRRRRRRVRPAARAPPCGRSRPRRRRSPAWTQIFTRSRNIGVILARAPAATARRGRRVSGAVGN